VYQDLFWLLLCGARSRQTQQPPEQQTRLLMQKVHSDPECFPNK